MKPIVKPIVLFLTCGCALVAASEGSATAEETRYKIVVNASNPVDSLSRAMISDMFLKKVKDWSDGAAVRPVDLRQDLPARESFSLEIHGRGVARVEAYWQQKVFTGRDVPPPEMDSDASVVKFVAANPNAIGYVSATANTKGVKVISVSK